MRYFVRMHSASQNAHCLYGRDQNGQDQKSEPEYNQKLQISNIPKLLIYGERARRDVNQI